MTTWHSLRFALACVALAAVKPTQASAQGALAPVGAPAPLFRTLNQIAPRTPIPGGGAATISQPGAYYLTGNIAVNSGNGVTITANNVRLDLNGFTISSSASPATGSGILISGGLTNLSICDGLIFGSVTNNGAASYGGPGFSNGVSFAGSQPLNARVTDVSVSGCLGYGINLNTNVGFNTGNVVSGCLVNDCAGFGILADTVLECSANVGTSSAIFAGTASRARGASFGGEGLHAAITAENCVGLSTNFYGVSVGDAALNCFGQSTSYDGLYCNGVAHNCYGQTATGGAALTAGTAANNCMGNHTGAGGMGLYAGKTVFGCVGVTAGASGYGIYTPGLINGSVGLGATNTFYAFKYNTP